MDDDEPMPYGEHMDGMKGIGKAVITCATAYGGRVDLVGFLDGSASVRVDDRTVGIWDPFEIDDAIASYWGRVAIEQNLLQSSAAMN